MVAYYNEKDPFAAAWLRNLINAKLIATGDVDERSIEDVVPLELNKYVQCHFFAGIGVWSYSLRRAEWPGERRVWTGSCPCQPFSQAGQGSAFDDERHLWPAFFHLIYQCKPDIIFGEQVASKNGLAWLDLVQDDMEGANYAFGALDTCAAGFGAPHIRQRLYWMGNTNGNGTWRERRGVRSSVNSKYGQHSTDNVGTPSFTSGPAYDASARRQWRGPSETSFRDGTARVQPERLCNISGLVNNNNTGLAQCISGTGILGESCGTLPWEAAIGTGVHAGGVGVTDSAGSQPWRQGIAPLGHRGSVDAASSTHAGCGSANSFWSAADWLRCKDDKWRPVEPGTFPLAHGAASRMGRLRGYGNAIVSPQAEEFIRAAMEYAP